MNRNIRKSRIKQWILFIIIALLLLGAEELVKRDVFREKESLIVCAPEDMEEAFKYALKKSELREKYKIIMTKEQENANICVYYGDENNTYMKPPCANFKLAFSPFIVAYNKDTNRNLEKDGLIVNSKYDENIYEIDLTSLIDVVLEDKKWEYYGIEGFENVKVVYPDPSTIYWYDFYNLMLVAANDGKYPQTKLDYDTAVSKLNLFFESENTEAIINFEEKVVRCNGFSKDIFYIVPEKLFISKSYDVRFLYPTETVNFNYYIQVDELGMKLVSAFQETNLNEENFYTKLKYKKYRSEDALEIGGIGSNIIGFGNAYNIVSIPETILWQVEDEN